MTDTKRQVTIKSYTAEKSFFYDYDKSKLCETFDYCFLFVCLFFPVKPFSKKNVFLEYYVNFTLGNCSNRWLIFSKMVRVTRAETKPAIWHRDMKK